MSGTLAGGDYFKLFSAASTSGTFAATNLPSLGADLAWNFNQASGELRIVSTVATNMTLSLSGDTLELAWPADHLGWRLQAQTNSLATGLATNWFDVAGSTSTNDIFLPVGDGSAFYRLVFP